MADVPSDPLVDNAIRIIKKEDGTISFVNKNDEKYLRNAFSSGHLNFLLGSAFSIETVPTLGNREAWFCEARSMTSQYPEDSDWQLAEQLLKAEYFASVMLPLLDAQPTGSQIRLIEATMKLVSARGTTTIPRRANIFTTNYDPFIELALEEKGVSFNDGFVGRDHPLLTTRSFSRLQYEQSLFMEYSSQVATLNVLKPHGSLTWKKGSKDGSITYVSHAALLSPFSDEYGSLFSSEQINEIMRLVGNDPDTTGMIRLREIAHQLSPEENRILLDFTAKYTADLCLVNPTKKKFEETVLDLFYYELLRIFANELDRSNALLVTFGFSFEDEHILDLTRRALDNPELILIISCYQDSNAFDYAEKFKGKSNVRLLRCDEPLDLNVFAAALEKIGR